MPIVSGKLVAIAVRAKSRAPMVEVEEARITAEQGVVGDSRGKPGDRQVTVLACEDWRDACAAVGRELKWTTRRANLFVEGLPLRETTNAILRIGEVVLQVTGETTPCARMEEAAAGLAEALKPAWRGGICCRVVQDGTVSAGVPVIMEAAGESA